MQQVATPTLHVLNIDLFDLEWFVCTVQHYIGKFIIEIELYAYSQTSIIHTTVQ